ncbi:hypothetical protein [Paraliomyxa miuraensis]|uniref:hypothetical protein n=1 Tax=Paraliomyxa miuraensis TaxID=376150 RepID=UPI00224E8613|nr:hypothetical protein [Paraliomyxa miuraensis]MCX4239287.1 hypothetical protein [Paraliomyxa miuraensis]
MAPAPRTVRSVRHLLPRLLAGTVALSLAMAPLSVQAAPDSGEIERLYVEGQDKYGEGDFAGAAAAWTRLLDRLPEAQANRATRENVLLNVVQAHLDGYARARKDDGSKDIDHLRSGKTVLDDYFADFKAAYGDRAAVSAAVQEKADELERALADAEKELAATPDPGPTEPVGPTEPKTDKNTPSIIVLESENDGGGLIVGGAVTIGIGVLSGVGLLVGGGIIANRAEEDFLAATTEDERDDAEKSGKTGNALQITGAIVGPVIALAGVGLIVAGVMKRKKAKAARDEKLRETIGVTPAAGRGFGGLVIQGRF